MHNTYTGMGNTPQAQSTQRFMDALQAIQGMSPSSMSSADLQSGQAQAQSAALGLQANQGQAVADAQNTLTQQAGIPGLTSQFGDLAGAFKMFLADQNLAGKYANTQNTNPYANPTLANANQGNGQIGGGAQAAPNPYMASPGQIANSTQTGEGFTNPSLTTQAMGAPMDATTNMLGLLQQALTGQRGKVDTATSKYEKNYTGAMNALANIADSFGKERDRQGADLGLDLETPNGANTTWGSFALVQGEDNAKRYADEMEKAYGGGQWGYRQTDKGWEILKPLAITADGTDSEPSATVHMVNYETGDEIEVSEDDATNWALKGYEEV